MNKFKLSYAMLLVLVISSPTVTGCGTTSKRDSKSVTISESEGGNGLVVAVSEALARSLVEGMIGSEIECGGDLDPEFAAVLRELDRGGRGSRASIRDENGDFSVRRSGSNLKMKIDDLDGGGRIEVKMPWAVAECLLDGSAKLSARDADSIRIKVIGSEGGSFEFTVD